MLTIQSKASCRAWAISDDLLEILQKHKSWQDSEKTEAYIDNGLVICMHNGDYYNPDAYSRSFSRLMEKAGVRKIKRGLHGLRHTAASFAIAAGENSIDVSAMLGHTKPSFTMDTYVHQFNHQKKETAAALSRTISEKVSKQTIDPRKDGGKKLPSRDKSNIMVREVG